LKLRRAWKGEETDAAAAAGLFRAEGGKAAREGAGLRDAASIAWACVAAVPLAAVVVGGPGGGPGGGEKRNEWRW
jgi:hypothetical protein